MNLVMVCKILYEVDNTQGSQNNWLLKWYIAKLVICTSNFARAYFIISYFLCKNLQYFLIIRKPSDFCVPGKCTCSGLHLDKIE